GPWNVEFVANLAQRNIAQGTDGISVNGNTGNSNVQFSIVQEGGLQVTMPFAPGVSPTAAQVQAHLLSIPALNPIDPNTTQPVPRVTVLGGPGGPFTIIFNGKLVNTAGIVVQNGTGNTTTNSGSAVVGQPAAVTIGPSIAADLSTAPTVITAVDVQ